MNSVEINMEPNKMQIGFLNYFIVNSTNFGGCFGIEEENFF